jgi:putative hydrolase of HD superfamily
MKAELDRATIAGIFDFLRQSGDLKDTLRSGFTNAGAQESTAEHSWRLALMVIALEPYLEGLDIARMLKMAILHDLGEAVTGDVPAIHQSGDPEIRRMAERDAIAMLSESLPDSVGGSVKAIAAEYGAGESREAAMMKGFDKLETIFQHATGQNPPDFDYSFNLHYGAGWTRDDALLAKLRGYVDSLTRARMAEAEGPES